MSLFLLFLCWSIFENRSNGQNLAKPSAAHLQFYEDNLGIIIHFNMQTFVPVNERKCCNTWNQSQFNPYLLDTDVWLSTASLFGAKYIVMVCDHFSGFSTFPTKQHNYSVTHSKWKNGTGNVIKSFVKSAYKYNIRPAIYYSVHENWYYNVSNFNLSNNSNNPLQIQFENMALGQLQELYDIFLNDGLTKKMAEIWFDAGIKQSQEFINRVNNLIINNTILYNLTSTCHSCGAMKYTSNVHWMGNEQGNMPYPNWGSNNNNCDYNQGISNGTRYCPAHCDVVLREHIWFWQLNPPQISSITTLISKYLTSIGHGCNLIMDMAPNMTGLLLQDDINAYKQFGDTINYMFYPIKNSIEYNNTLLINNTNPIFIINNNNINTITLKINNINKNYLGFGGIEIRENIVNGQRIETHLIEIYDKEINKWYNLTNPKYSLTIGNKRIQTYNITNLNIKGDQIKITILTYVGQQNPNLVKLKSIKLLDWTYLSQNQLKNLNWTQLIKAGK